MPAKTKCSKKTSKDPRPTQRLSSSSETQGPTDASEWNHATENQEDKVILNGKMIGRDKL